MGIKVLKDKHFTREVDWVNLSYVTVDEISSKLMQKEDCDDRGKGGKILKEGKPVININKNPHSYRLINKQKEVPFLPWTVRPWIWVKESFWIKGR